MWSTYEYVIYRVSKEILCRTRKELRTVLQIRMELNRASMSKSFWRFPALRQFEYLQIICVWHQSWAAAISVYLMAQILDIWIYFICMYVVYKIM